ncbi:MAG: hypothetical protein ACAI44_01930 [Candidatus Sericytochromatia bacterium]
MACPFRLKRPDRVCLSSQPGWGLGIRAILCLFVLTSFMAPPVSPPSSSSVLLVGLQGVANRILAWPALLKGPNRSLMLGIGLCLLACVPQPQPTPQVSSSSSPKPTGSPSLPQATPTPSPVLEKRADGRYCEPLPKGNPKPELKYPVDLAVSSDGQDIYIVAKHCQDDVSQKPYLDSFSFPDCGSKPDSRNVISRSYIYHLRPGQGIEILKIDGQPPLSCELGEDIEMDSQGRLYVTTPYNHRVYRIDPKQNELEQLVEARQKKLLSSSVESAEPLQGPANLYLHEDQLYFRLWEDLTTSVRESHIAVLDQTKGYTILVSLPRDQYRGSPIFGFSSWEGSKGSKKDLCIFQLQDSRVYCRYPFPSALDSQSYGFFSYFFDPYQPVGSYIDRRPLHDSTLGDMKIDPKLNIYASHPATHRLLRLSTYPSAADYYKNYLFVFAGSGEAGLKDGYFEEAQFRQPAGLALDTQQNLYVADMGNHAIRKITQEHNVTTLYVEQQ